MQLCDNFPESQRETEGVITERKRDPLLPFRELTSSLGEHVSLTNVSLTMLLRRACSMCRLMGTCILLHVIKAVEG